eukprot:CAMPEP_0181201652 /NCGR_PEP_ID=MMETSP1096-20121128/18421_1 /TAXON_ID=156174 ORGANISM="Chrysochromulina ericina, Strain CCMP281" /NCGR_SAMPLE_ID=MMETSP1096 /ASSEMBLY_ACC=CAM_ASM_000453 /LENGTH=331 /DNA_ID=CAMNT_0023292109 /DNA_START=182 /DNA_END=1177 /DNA_ORIENTATION=+
MAFVVTDSSVTEQQEFRALEYVCFVCVLGHNMDIWFLEGGQLRIAGDHNKRVLRSLIETKPASLFRAILMIAIVVVRIIGSVTDQHTLFEMYQVLVSMVAGVQIIWILEYMILLDNNLGALILTVKEMLRDVSLFMVIFSIVIMASTIPFVCFSRMGYYEGEYADDFHPRSTITVPLWSTFGEFALSQSTANNIGQWLTMMFLWCSTFISSVLLVNLLIAMFTKTYERLQTNASLELIWFKWQKLLVLLHSDWRSPPSATPVTVLAALASRLGRRCCTAKSVVNNTEERAVIDKSSSTERDNSSKPPLLRAASSLYVDEVARAASFPIKGK